MTTVPNHGDGNSLTQLRYQFLSTLQLRRESLASANAKHESQAGIMPPAKLALCQIVPGTKITRRQLLDMDREWAAHHEAGHFVVVRQFSVDSVESRIWETEEGPSLGDNGVVGTTEFFAMRGASNFRFAVVAWAGCLAEELVDRTFEEWKDDLWWFWEASGELDISPKDKAAIEAHPMRWRSFKTAAAMIIKRRAELEKVAGDLERFGGVHARGKDYYSVFHCGRIHTKYPDDP
jgi:hypothetical protein